MTIEFLPEKDSKIVTTLHDVLNLKRELSESYKDLIRKQEERDFYLPQEFSEHWGRFFKEPDDFPNTYKLFTERLVGNLLIDVGGGSGYSDFAHKFGAATYINVDRDIGSKETPPNPLVALDDKIVDGLHILDVKSDMLDFVSHVKDDSANFMLNGIDICVIDDVEYHKALALELARATKPGGLVFGVDSHIDWIWEGLGDKAPLRKKKTDPWLIINTFIYQKSE